MVSMACGGPTGLNMSAPLNSDKLKKVSFSPEHYLNRELSWLAFNWRVLEEAENPAVPLLELLDTLDRTTTAPVRDAVVVQHPLQPFDIRNVIRGDLIPGQPFTFDATALVAARTAHGTRPPRPAFVAEPLPNPAPADVSLAELSAFFRDPVRGFFRALDYTLPWDVDGIADAMPVEIDALQQWGVGDRMLRDILRGMIARDAGLR